LVRVSYGESEHLNMIQIANISLDYGHLRGWIFFYLKNWLKNWYPHPSQFQFLTKTGSDETG
jgi:hypothetical protein